MAIPDIPFKFILSMLGFVKQQRQVFFTLDLCKISSHDL